MIDSHCHLQDPKFRSDRDEVIQRAFEAGLQAMVVIGYDMPSSRQAVEVAESFENVYAAIGVHPHDARTVSNSDMNGLARLAESDRVVAIGETGLDFYRNLSPRESQFAVFREHLSLARDSGLPVVIHARDADKETFDVLADYAVEGTPREGLLGVMHCYAGDLDLARRYVELNFVISIAGTCTYPRSETTREVAAAIPLEAMVVETDAPYLPPQSRRGQRNEPAYVSETVQLIAELRGDTADTIATATSATARRLFRLDEREVVARDEGRRPG